MGSLVPFGKAETSDSKKVGEWLYTVLIESKNFESTLVSLCIDLLCYTIQLNR